MKRLETRNGIEIIRVLSGSNSVLLLKRRDNYIMVDSGLNKKCNKIYDKLDKLGFNKELSLKGLILTHSHGDHAGNAIKIKEKYKTQIIAHELALKRLKKGEHLGEENTYKPVDCDIVVKDSFDLRSLGIDGYIIHTPGHTMGSISIILDNEIAITGDALPVKTWSSEFAITGDSPDLQKESCKKLVDLGCKLYICSHGKPYEKDILKAKYEKYIVGNE